MSAFKTAVSSTLLMLLFIGLFGFVFSGKVEGSGESWWNSAWNYRTRINVTETSGYEIDNFPVEVSLEHNGHLKTDGSDLRVIDSSSEIPYAITNISSSWVTLIFELNMTGLSTREISIYYGNPNALSPNYPLVPLTISGGSKQGNASIDNTILIGWDNAAWGPQPGYYLINGNLVYLDNNQVVLWDDFRLISYPNGSSIPQESENLLTSSDTWKGGIGRSHISLGNNVERSFGLGGFQKYIQTPVYVDLVFADVSLRIYKGQTFVETEQADRLQMEGTSWDFAEYQNSSEQNIIDGLNTNGPPSDPTWNIMYNSSVDPGWMAYRNSMSGYVFGAIGFDTNSSYQFYFSAKESHAWDRQIMFDYTVNQMQSPYDQPTGCRIYWYADTSNNYAGINRTATVLANLPVTSFASVETPEFTSFIILPFFMIAMLIVVAFYKKKAMLQSTS